MGDAELYATCVFAFFLLATLALLLCQLPLYAIATAILAHAYGTAP